MGIAVSHHCCSPQGHTGLGRRCLTHPLRTRPGSGSPGAGSFLLEAQTLQLGPPLYPEARAGLKAKLEASPWGPWGPRRSLGRRQEQGLGLLSWEQTQPGGAGPWGQSPAEHGPLFLPRPGARGQPGSPHGHTGGPDITPPPGQTPPTGSTHRTPFRIRLGSWEGHEGVPRTPGPALPVAPRARPNHRSGARRPLGPERPPGLQRAPRRGCPRCGHAGYHCDSKIEWGRRGPGWPPG